MADDATSLRSGALPLAPRRFTWAEVTAMGEAGVFAEGERVELIEGDVYAMPPEGPRHANGVQVLVRYFLRTLPQTLELFVRAPVILPDGVVVPDLSVFPAGTRAQAMRADAAALIVEVGDSTLRHDLSRKEPRYRAAGLPELWLVAAASRSISVRRDPAPEGWRFQHAFEPPQRIAPLCLADLPPEAGFAIGDLPEPEADEA